ncbi:Pre-mRNA splicing Prp18-interacting factor-domain-containing protein [Lipomyces arxii]|uniref:Pre-mRNA splicing Prp18-interacting factor-domain-containing protein n=1 Tax=Lipomyces arxii TaxID=56418 RepID=UPI0034CE1989
MSEKDSDSAKFNFKTFDPDRKQVEDPTKDSTYQRRRAQQGGDQPPIERDADGKEINPYIPQFISKAPWYVDQSGEKSLRHQRLQKDRDQIEADLKDVWYKRGVKAGPAATKYRKGACENCGAMTHKAKDCLERPRKVGAKYSGKDIQADDLIQDIPMTWDSKRDRWNGYDASAHAKVISDYQQLEDLRNKLAEERGNDEDPDKYNTDTSKQPGQGFDADARMSTRTLRIREDAAAYLKNLDSGGDDEYNPKSRTMHGEKSKIIDSKLIASEDDFVRSNGDAQDFESLQRFAWNATEKGAAVHIEANPTEGALAKRKHDEETDQKAKKLKKELLEKYG